MAVEHPLWPLVVLESTGVANGQTVGAPVPASSSRPTFVKPGDSSQAGLQEVVCLDGQELNMDGVFAGHRACVALFYSLLLAFNILIDIFRCGSSSSFYCNSCRSTESEGKYTCVGNTDISAMAEDGVGNQMAMSPFDPMVVYTAVSLSIGIFFLAHWQMAGALRGTFVDNFSCLRPWGAPRIALDPQWAAGLFYAGGHTSFAGSPARALSQSAFLDELNSDGKADLVERLVGATRAALRGAWVTPPPPATAEGSTSTSSGSSNAALYWALEALLRETKQYRPVVVRTDKRMCPPSVEEAGGCVLEYLGDTPVDVPAHLMPLPRGTTAVSAVAGGTTAGSAAAGGTTAAPVAWSEDCGRGLDGDADGIAGPSCRLRRSGSSREVPERQAGAVAPPAWNPQGPPAAFAAPAAAPLVAPARRLSTRRDALAACLRLRSRCHSRRWCCRLSSAPGGSAAEETHWGCEAGAWGADLAMLGRAHDAAHCVQPYRPLQSACGS